MPKNNLRSPDREGPVVLGRLLTQKIFLQPVKVFMWVTGFTLAPGYCHGGYMGAVRFSALQ